MAMGVALFLLPVLLPGQAMAQAPTPPESDQRPVQAFGRDHPSCREWTDGCLVCARRADGAAACSMVGTACLPAAIVCIGSGD